MLGCFCVQTLQCSPSALVHSGMFLRRGYVTEGGKRKGGEGEGKRKERGG